MRPTTPAAPPLRLAFVGCGKIAGNYAGSVLRHPEWFTIVGAFDLVPERAQAFCARHGGRPFQALDDLVDADDVEVVVNLTIHDAHAEVSRRALEAGKHVHTEKPLATNREDARRLVALADEAGLLLACAPYIMLGGPQQTLWKLVRDGMIGRPLEAVGHAMYGGIERRNPSAEAFLSAGPMFDVGCYPLSLLTTIFGPVRRIIGASADVLIPQRTLAVGPRQGATITLTAPDHVTALLEFANGLVARLTASFTVSAPWLPRIEIHGSEGALSLASRPSDGGPLQLWPAGGRQWQTVPSIGDPSPAQGASRGLLDVYEALRYDQPLHYTGQQGYHIVDVCLSALECATEGRPQDVHTTFVPPP
ncbi:MAG: Gfo/Idh/MocA family protein, partial [Chloroflexota bacterium]